LDEDDGFAGGVGQVAGGGEGEDGIGEGGSGVGEVVEHFFGVDLL